MKGCDFSQVEVVVDFIQEENKKNVHLRSFLLEKEEDNVLTFQIQGLGKPHAHCQHHK
jgi:hypothetical protein